MIKINAKGLEFNYEVRHAEENEIFNKLVKSVIREEERAKRTREVSNAEPKPEKHLLEELLEKASDDAEVNKDTLDKILEKEDKTENIKEWGDSEKPMTRKEFIEEKKNNPATTKPVEYKERQREDFAPREQYNNRKILVAIKCPGCGDTIVAFTDKDTLSCNKCNTDFGFDKSHLTIAKYKCACCGIGTGLLYTNAQRKDGEIITVNCKVCSSPIDMQYHPKHKKFLDMNSFR